MRIGIIADAVSAEQLGSVGILYAEFIRELCKNKDVQVFAIGFDSIKREFPINCEKIVLDEVSYTKREPLPKFISFRKAVSAINKFHKLILNIKAVRIINDLKLDIIHCPSEGYIPFYFWFVNAKKVITIHGYTIFVMSKDLVPERFNLRERFSRWCIRMFKNRVNQFVTVSKCAVDKVSRGYGIDESDIIVIYNGLNHEKFRPYSENEISPMLSKCGIRPPYMLHVSNYKPVKNVIRIVQSFNKLLKTNALADYQLVIAGPKVHEYNKVVEIIVKNHLSDRINFLGYIGENLPALYAGAQFTVFPSLVESFGMPILESIACGTPVLTSSIYSMPEIAGGAALFINPYSMEDTAKGMLTLIENKELREELRRKGLTRAKEFTWERCTNEHIKLYQTLVNANS